MDVRITNIAGILEGHADIDPGINTVQASNWQGKSSFVRAVETAFGVRAPLTEGKEAGEVVVELDGDTHTVRLDRNGPNVVSDGDPVLDDEYDRLLVDLFAFLDEDNEVRSAVRDGRDLAEVLTRPLDVADIDGRIGELRDERDSVEIELQRAEERADRLVSLTQRRNELESELEELRERETKFEDAMPSEMREQLSDHRAERERVTDLIERLERTLSRSREKLTAAYEEYEAIETTDTDDIEDELVAVREEYERAREDEELLQSVYSANKRLVEEDRLDLLADVDRGLLEDTHSCWLCGNDTTADVLGAQLEAIGDEVLELREAVDEYEERMERLESERDAVERKRQRKADLESRITKLEETISEREGNLSSARDRLNSVDDEIDRLEAEVDGADEEVSDVRSEIKYKEAELEDLADDIEEAETAAGRVETLREETESLTDEITELRTRKEKVRNRIRTEFDDAIRTTVSRFETSFETARLTSEFELVVARDGREVGLDALSEGEVELLGLVTAVAGFEAYDVADVTPVVLLDQLGGLSDGTLETLADYLDDLTRILILTAYPENTSFGENRIDPADWTVIRQAHSSA